MDLINIKFRGVAKCYQFDSTGFDLSPGDPVVVESERGVQLGSVVKIFREIDYDGGRKSPRKILRKGSERDMDSHGKNKEKENTAHQFCLERISARKLEMKLVRTEYLLDSSKVVFYFTADGRIDFRELVKDLANRLKTRIEMRQIGVRDEAKMVGGIGSCGKSLCCATHLKGFEPITVKLAKDQNLTLNPSKLSGLCGRLMCCLIYEHKVYKVLRDVPDHKREELLPEEREYSLSLNFEDSHE
jgi:cell fate regulator YaaT (PSP1 superfamily)